MSLATAAPIPFSAMPPIRDYRDVPKRPRREAPDPLPQLGPAPVLIDIDRIEPNPLNPRAAFDEAELQQLAESLGSPTRLLQPIHVEPIDGLAERYRIISGERRWRAAQLAGWRTIPAWVLRVPPEVAVQIMVDENLMRADLNPLERCQALERLVRPKGQGGAGLSQEAVSKRYGRSKTWCCNMLRVLRLPAEFQEQVAAGELALTEARLLVSYVERADVLAAVAVDRQRNPADWTPRINFEKRLAELVQRLDRLAAAAGEGPAGESLSPESTAGDVAAIAAGDVAEASAAAAGVPLARRSAPVDHSTGGDRHARGNGQAGADPRGEIAAEPLDRDELLAECQALLEHCNEYDLAEVKRFLTNLLGA